MSVSSYFGYDLNKIPNEYFLFIIAFCIGIIGVCLIEPKPTVIIRWPTP